MGTSRYNRGQFPILATVERNEVNFHFPPPLQLLAKLKAVAKVLLYTNTRKNSSETPNSCSHTPHTKNHTSCSY
ncbi:MAG: hypothetical protein R3E32_25495 [Chitinophagales bacterium]